MHLLSLIERHIRRHDIPPTRFGRDAAGDPRLVSDLRLGREPGERLKARVLKAIAARENAARNLRD